MAELDDQTSNESILGTFISDDKKRKRQNDALLDIGSLSESENAVQFRKPMKRNVSADHSRASFLSKKTKVTHHSHGTVGGVVLTLGLGETGQLGLGEAITESLRPALVPLPEKIVQVVAGGMHTACLSETGTVLTSRTYVTVLGWDPLFPGHTALRVLVTRGKGGSAFISFFKCWRTQQPPLTINIYTFGCNDEGSLGRYTHTEGSECEPGKVELKEKVVQISAGDSHTGALTEDGRVFLFGSFRDNNGIIGLLEPLKPSVLPVEVHINIPVIKIASGSDHLVMLTSEGDLYTSGCGEQGQLGRVPERFTNRGGRRGLERLLLPQCIHVKAKGSGRVLFQDAFCGAYFTFAISKEGLVYGFGLANYHQLGTNSTSSCFSPQQLSTFKNSSMSWVCFSGGQHHTICLDSDGKAYCLGRAEYGRLGIGEEAEEKREPTLITGLPFVSSVACGASVSFAVTRDGRVFSWGMGTNYQLGIGDEEDAWIPTEMEGKHLKNRMVLSASSGGCLQVTPALYNIYNTTLKVDFTLGHILSRGMSTNDQLGIGDEEEDVWIPTEMEGKQLKNRMVLSASSGRQHTVLLAIDKTPPS